MRATVRLVDHPQGQQVPETGAVDSTQEAEVLLPRDMLDPLWTREHLERLARAYWQYLHRISLGLLRTVYAPDGPTVVLGARSLAVLRFGRVADRAWLAGREGGSGQWVPADLSRARPSGHATRTCPARGIRRRSQLLSLAARERALRAVGHPPVQRDPAANPRGRHTRVPAIAGPARAAVASGPAGDFASPLGRE